MKKIFCFLLTLLLLLPCFTSCKFMTLSDSEAKAELDRLLPKAKELTEIFYGKGLPFTEISEDSTDYYAFVKEDAPYQSIEQLQAAAEKVFTPEYLVGVYEYAFEGSEYYASRYFTDEKGNLKINTRLEPMALLAEIDTTNAKVLEGTPSTVLVQVDAVNSAGKKMQKKITIVNVDGVWLLDCAGY